MDRHAIANEHFTAEEKLIHGGGYKTACTTAILGFFGIEKNSFKYSQSLEDMVRIFRRNGFRSIPQRKRDHVGQPIEKINQFFSRGFYVVLVHGHVLLAYVSDSGKLTFPMDTSHDPKNLIQRAIKIVAA